MFASNRSNSADALWPDSKWKNVSQSMVLFRDFLNVSNLSWDSGCLICF